MPLNDLMPSTFTDADIDDIKQLLTLLENKMVGKTVNLTPTERKKYGSINEQSKLFVDKVNDFSTSNPAFNSPHVNWPEYGADLKARKNLESIGNRMAGLQEQIDDTKLLHDKDNYQQSLTQYAYITYLSEQNVPGTTTVKEELSQFFKRSK